jgi:hypothetical protein
MHEILEGSDEYPDVRAEPEPLTSARMTSRTFGFIAAKLGLNWEMFIILGQMNVPGGRHTLKLVGRLLTTPIKS